MGGENVLREGGGEGGVLEEVGVLDVCRGGGDVLASWFGGKKGGGGGLQRSKMPFAVGQ